MKYFNITCFPRRRGRSRLCSAGGWRQGRRGSATHAPSTTDEGIKCRLYWYLIEFREWRYGQSCWYFRPLLWTNAPITFSLVHLPNLPCVNKCRIRMVVWRASTGVIHMLRLLYKTMLRLLQARLPCVADPETFYVYPAPAFYTKFDSGSKAFCKKVCKHICDVGLVLQFKPALPSCAGRGVPSRLLITIQKNSNFHVSKICFPWIK